MFNLEILTEVGSLQKILGNELDTHLLSTHFPKDIVEQYEKFSTNNWFVRLKSGKTIHFGQLLTHRI